MKLLFPLQVLVLLLLVVSCSKKDSVEQKPAGDFSFLADRSSVILPSGNLIYLQNPAVAQPRVRPAGSGFFLTASETGSYMNSILFTGFIKADKLEVGTYDAAMYCQLGIMAFDSSINSSITITKIVNGRASGTFYGTIYSVIYSIVNNPPVVISNGKFENVQIQN